LFQVFTPVYVNNNPKNPVTGDIKLQLSAVPHTDSCAPLNNCLANANFTPQFNCNTDTAVRFINYSTFGSAIAFRWDFGYNNQSSTEVSPAFNFPELATAATYNVKLVVDNTSCSTKDSVTIPVTVPGRPGVHLGDDISLCNGGNLVLDATTFPGAVYSWNTGATTPTITISQQGSVEEYSVKVTYNGCSKSDTIKVAINNMTANRLNITDTICHGQTYALPSGAIVSNSGIFTDTLRAKNGCDSLITSLTLTIKKAIVSDTTVTICPGKAIHFLLV
jgi:PKD repeat protein